MTINQQICSMFHPDMQQLTITISFTPACFPLLDGKLRDRPGHSSSGQNTVDFLANGRIAAIYYDLFKKQFLLKVH